MRILLALLFWLPLQAWSAQIRVTDRDGQPVAGAAVILGDELTAVAPTNLVTDANGYFQIPVDWKSVKDVTVRAQGFVLTTFSKLEPAQALLQLHREDSRQYFKVSGQAVDFQGIKKDGKVDFGLVYPALSRRDIVDFDITSVVSPQSDQIDVITEKISIPSNLSLPKQTETYLLPINLNKPEFRLFVRKPGNYKIMATQGRFPLARVINELQNGKSIFQVINNFEFLNAGQISVDINADTSVGDVSVKTISYGGTISVLGPTIPAGHGVISAALVDQNGLLFPSDLKSLVTGQATFLKVPQATDTNMVISLLTEEPKQQGEDDELKNEIQFGPLNWLVNSFKNFMNAVAMKPKQGPGETELPTGMSLALQPAKGQVTPDFLDMVPVPQILGEYQLTARSPAANSTILPVATYVVLSEIETPTDGSQIPVEKRFRVWESYLPGWTGVINLPRIKLATSADKKYRWEVYFLGRRPDYSETPTYFLDGITHVSRNSVDLN